jgi:hypothetical protein
MTGADPKYRDAVITRLSEILNMSKEHGMKVDLAGNYIFNNPANGKEGVNEKYKSTGKFKKKGIFGLGGTNMDDNALNNLAYYTIEKLIRQQQTNPSSLDDTQYTSHMAEVEARLEKA